MTSLVTVRQWRDPKAAQCLCDWAAAEGWNPGIQDAEIFYTADPGGWWIAETAEGQPVGGVSLVHGEENGFAFLGLYIVRPDWRGRGIGLRLWNAAIAASPAVCIGLDGVPAEQENYARSGFVMAFRSQRFRFTAQHVAGVVGADVLTLGSVPFDEVCALDRAVAFPAQRRAFLRRWIAPEAGAGLAIVRDGVLRGYGVIRPCLSGYKVGPLVAENEDDARALLAALVGAVHAKEGYLDVPHANPAAVALAADLGLEAVFETARMYRGAEPAALDVSRLWGVTTFELG
jgi:GNAT superfamily N-acetyltransferase